MSTPPDGARSTAPTNPPADPSPTPPAAGWPCTTWLLAQRRVFELLDYRHREAAARSCGERPSAVLIRLGQWDEIAFDELIADPAALAGAYGPDEITAGWVDYQEFRDPEGAGADARERVREMDQFDQSLWEMTWGWLRPGDPAAERNGRPPPERPPEGSSPCPVYFVSHPARVATTGLFVPVVSLPGYALHIPIDIPFERDFPHPPAADRSEVGPSRRTLMDAGNEVAGATVSRLPAELIDCAIRPAVREWVREWVRQEQRRWIERQPDQAAALERVTDDALPVALASLPADCRWWLFVYAQMRGTERVECPPSGEWWGDPLAAIRWPFAASAAVLGELAAEALARGGSCGFPSSPPSSRPRRGGRPREFDPEKDRTAVAMMEAGRPPDEIARELGYRHPHDVRNATERLRKGRRPR